MVISGITGNFSPTCIIEQVDFSGFIALFRIYLCYYTIRCKLGYEITAQLTVQIQEKS